MRTPKDNTPNTNKDMTNKPASNVPYYLLPLDEQADEFVSSEDGVKVIEACKNIMKDKLENN